MKSSDKSKPESSFSIPLWVPALFSAIAAGASAYAAWKSFDIAQETFSLAQEALDLDQQKLEDSRTLIQFDVKFEDKKNWSVSLYQVSGEAYHIPTIKITPSLWGEQGELKLGKHITKTPDSEQGRSLPLYKFENLESEICANQQITPCNIAILMFEFTVHGDEREEWLS